MQFQKTHQDEPVLKRGRCRRRTTPCGSCGVFCHRLASWSTKTEILIENKTANGLYSNISEFILIPKPSKLPLRLFCLCQLELLVEPSKRINGYGKSDKRVKSKKDWMVAPTHSGCLLYTRCVSCWAGGRGHVCMLSQWKQTEKRREMCAYTQCKDRNKRWRVN